MRELLLLMPLCPLRRHLVRSLLLLMPLLLLRQSLELERRRAAEAAEQAGEAARTLNSRVAALEAERAGLEKQLLQEKVRGGSLGSALG